MTLSRITYIALTLTALAISEVTDAQGFAGHIVDKGGKAIEGATIIETQTLTGSVTDATGRFAIRYAGKYPTRVAVRSLGYKADTLTIPTASRDIKIVMNIEDIESDEVSVVGRKMNTGFEKIDASVAANAVSTDAGVEAVIKSQMGVASNNELSSQYRVRGGSFDENLVYVNGIEVYRPFLIRSGEQEGLSFVNPDMVEEINFSAGGFDASYGDKLSSVLDVTYKRPRQFHAGGRVSLLGAQVHAEGSAASGRLTHITGVRYKTNQYLFGSLDTKGDYSPTFLDAQTFWTITPGSGRTTVNLLAYFAQNTYKFTPTDRETSFGTVSDAKTLTIYFEGGERDKYRTCVAAASVDHTPSDRLKLNLTASMFRTEEEETYDILGEYWLQEATNSQSQTAVDQSENIGVGGYMQHARNFLFGEVYALSVGADIALGTYNSMRAQAKATREHYTDLTDEWAYTDSAGYMTSPSAGSLSMDETRYADNALWQTRFEAYVCNTTKGIPVGDGVMTLTTGMRIARQDIGGVIWSPRVSANLMTGRWRFRLAAGRYGQLPNLREMKRPDATLNRDLGPQKSWQLIGGADLYFGSEERPMKFSVEAYGKWLRDLNPYSIDNVRMRYEAENCASGYAVGMDFKLNGELVKGAESWATLSIMQTQEDIEGDGHGYIPRPSDQRLQFSMMVQDYMPGNKSVTAMLSMFFGTGLPFGPAGSERWQQTSRMPGYKRVDLGLYKDFALTKEGDQRRERLRSAKIGLEIFNLFDFANTISHFWVSDTDGHQYGVPNYLTSRRVNVKISIEL